MTQARTGCGEARADALVARRLLGLKLSSLLVIAAGAGCEDTNAPASDAASKGTTTMTAGFADAGGGAAPSSGAADAANGDARAGGAPSTGDNPGNTSSVPSDASASGDTGATDGADSSAAGASASVATSCAQQGPGLDTCGPQGHESCCVSLPVEGGTYFRTYTNTGNGATGTADPATVSPFRLDKYEVTVGRFRQFVNYLVAGGAPPAAGSGKHTHLNGGMGLTDSARSGGSERGWDAAWNTHIPSGAGAGAGAQWTRGLSCSPYANWTESPGSNEEQPLTCLDWYEAYAFCIWDAGFLPSEAEWKYAAAGGDELRKFPWGSDNPGAQSQYAMYDCYYPTGSAGNCTSLANIAKVGSTPKGVGRYGQLDLAGSVWEWCLDQYAPYASPCSDCAYLSGATDRVLPGGGFHTGLTPYLLSSNRVGVNYATTYRGTYGVGVRCARVP
jgi:formylglycine-generating enzyme required for sulfatase activity